MPDCLVSPSFAEELARYGPEPSHAAVPLAAAQAYCRQLARTHYENFTVASWLLPRELRAHFFPIYAYCRWADDLADETADPARSLELLAWWEGQLRACYQGVATHPVFVALRPTIDAFAIPIEPFANLLVAFRQDQQVRRYATADEVLDYCRYSANPVGRLVLYLGRACDAPRAALSDAICTGLQLANFCQDVARDYDNDRIYLPRVTLESAGYTPEMFARREYNPAFRRALAEEVERADSYLRAGLPLVDRVPPALRVDVSLFVQGGMAVLGAIRRIDYNVWACRPTVSKLTRLGLLARCWWRSSY